ncbi:hypothetical protein D3C75_1266440 [compost metagenome]
MHGAIALVAFQELQAQRLEFRRFRGQAECRLDHGTGTAGNHIANPLLVHCRQVAIGAHALADGDEIRRRIEQGAVHVEKYCS